MNLMQQVVNCWVNAGSPPVGGLQFVGGKTALRNTAGTWTISLTDLTGGIGTQPEPGDYVIVAQQGDTAVNHDFVCSTAGFVELEDRYRNGGHDLNLGVHAKIMGDPADSSVQFTSPNTTNPRALVIHVWRGVDPDTPQDVARAYTDGVNSGVPNAPAITPVTPGAMIIVIGASGVPSSGNATPLSADLDHFIEAQETSGIYRAKIGIGSTPWSGEGAYDPDAWITDSGTWGALTMALRPA